MKNDFYVMDIETNTAWKKDGTRFLPCAVWMYLGCIMRSNGDFHFFHDWAEYAKALKNVQQNSIIYVHNLSYEIEFLSRNGFYFDKIIANEKHKIISARDVDRNIIYRCSYKLLDKSLAEVGKDVGLDKLEYEYDGLRTRENLTSKDYEYNKRDCEIVVLAIKKELTKYKDIAKIPLTKTGKVRRHIAENDNGELASRARSAFPPEEIYQLLEDAFIGGTTFGNPAYFGQIVHNVYSYDKKSSYPAVMLSKRFPVKFGRLLKGEEAQKVFENIVSGMEYMGTYEICNVRAKDRRILFLPRYKTKNGTLNARAFNGKLYYAEKIIITLDSVTLRLFKDLYFYDSIVCRELAIATSVRRLPSAFLKTIAQLAEQKNALALIKDRSEADAEEYARVKEMINSIYGAMVQKFRNFLYTIDSTGEWEQIEDKYKMPKHLYRIYSVGVWVTAYARESLFRDGILKVGAENFVYCDTDSVKTFEPLKIGDYFDADTVEYLQSILTKKEFEAIKNFGKFEHEEKNYCDDFMHLGAKKYFYNKKGKFGYTVAGLPKPHKAEKTGGIVPKSMDEIRDGGIEFESVKLAHKFVNNEFEKDNVWEKKGNNFFPLEWKKIKGKGGVALYPASYTLSADPMDCDYCKDYGCTWVGKVLDMRNEFIDLEQLDYILRHKGV